MSLCNVWVSRDRALVAVDTLCVDFYGSFHHRSKVHHLPHSGLVVAGRGVAQFGRVVLNVCDELLVSYDEANEQAGAILEYATNLLREESKDKPEVWERLNFGQQEVVFAGWSEQRNSFHATSYKRMEDGGEFVTTPIDYCCVGPGEANWGTPPLDDLSTAEGMERLARWQVMHSRQAFPSSAIGGRLLLVEMTRGCVTVKTHCDLG